MKDPFFLFLASYCHPGVCLCETNSFVLMSLWFSLLSFFPLIKTCLGTDILVLIWMRSQRVFHFYVKKALQEHVRICTLLCVRDNGQLLLWFTVSVSWLYIRAVPKDSECAVLLQRGGVCFRLKIGPTYNFRVLLRSPILQSLWYMSLRFLFKVSRGRKLISWVCTNVLIFPLFRRTQI